MANCIARSWITFTVTENDATTGNGGPNLVFYETKDRPRTVCAKNQLDLLTLYLGVTRHDITK